MINKQREERRMAMGLNNPKHDWWARRKNKDKWIGGRLMPQKILMELRKKMRDGREKIQQIRLKWYQRVWNFIKKICLNTKTV